MKKLVFVVLVSFAAMQAGGCIITSGDDDDPPIDGVGNFDVTWNLQPGGCPIGGDSVQVVTQEIDSTGAPIGGVGEDIFNCADGGGATQDFALGDYEITVNVVSDDESTLFAQSDTLEASLINDLVTVGVTFSFPTDEAAFGLTWGINGGPADVTSCNDAAAMSLSVILTGGTSVDTELACPAGEGTTADVPLDTYTVAIDLVDEQGLAVTDDSTVLANEVLDVGNVIEDLGDFDLIVSP